MYRKKTEFNTTCGFRHLLGVLENIPHRYWGTTAFAREKKKEEHSCSIYKEGKMGTFIIYSFTHLIFI